MSFNLNYIICSLLALLVIDRLISFIKWSVKLFFVFFSGHLCCKKIGQLQISFTPFHFPDPFPSPQIYPFAPFQFHDLFLHHKITLSLSTAQFIHISFRVHFTFISCSFSFHFYRISDLNGKRYKKEVA
jgi:hypothetical protein